MRHLLQPRVLGMASLAALLSALACYPRLSLWLHARYPVWYLDATIFFCTITLWAFVFAWHAPYTGRPAFIFKLEPGLTLAATVLAIGAGSAYHLWLDPPLRLILPEDYPSNLQHWLATVLFGFGLTQLFCIFAPCDWLMRLTKNRWIATGLTGFFGAVMQAMRIHSVATLPVSAEDHPAISLSPLLLITLLVLRFAGGCLAVAFYLRGGILVVWWWALLIESRLLLDLVGRP
jgi:hypothetical protein